MPLASPPPLPPRTTHFGKQSVLEHEKTPLVQNVFSNVAHRYDLMNTLMSCGLHHLWKRTMLDMILPRPTHALLDIAGGTGDIAFAFLHRYRGARATIVDLNPDMITVGQSRSAHLPAQLQQRLDWVHGDAMALPFADASFARATMAFGIRNVTRIEDALCEAHRILTPGGRFVVLEFSDVTPALRGLYDCYSYRMIPWLGELMTQDRDAYQYLVDSIRQFPSKTDFADMMRESGFKNVQIRSLTGGIVAVHTGWKL